jgi:polyisoprenoid-binding protein YceI
MRLNLTSIVISFSFTACIQHTYEYPDCNEGIGGAVEDSSDIPSPSDELENSTESSTSDETEGALDNEDTSKPIQYFFDDAQSLLYVQVYKDPNALASGLAHNHVMRATNWTGDVMYNPESLDVCSMSFTLPVLDLAVDEDAMRDVVGYGDTINAADRATIREHMLDSNQLNASQFTSIWFESTYCEATDSGLMVTGDMFIAGTTTEMIVNVTVTPTADKFYMSSVIDFTHADFNITPYEAFFGAIRNAEPLTITFDMVGFAG